MTVYLIVEDGAILEGLSEADFLAACLESIRAGTVERHAALTDADLEAMEAEHIGLDESKPYAL